MIFHSICVCIFVSQGEVEQISDYTFYGLAGLEEFWYKNATHLDNQGFVTYTLAANKNYSIFFEVFTSAGTMNVSHDTFSRSHTTIHVATVFTFNSPSNL